jgi:hypothetical protein
MALLLHCVACSLQSALSTEAQLAIMQHVGQNALRDSLGTVEKKLMDGVAPSRE